MDRRPIGVFDSGLGGLCAVSELTKILPGEDIIYFGDTGRVPYGSRSIQTLRKYAAEDIAFLLSHDVKMILAACGTVSSSVLEDFAGECPVPLLGVVDGAVKKAISLCRGGKIGIIGTETTVNSGIFERKIAASMPEAKLKSIACPLFVPLVENGIAPDDIVAETVCSRYMEAFDGENIDALIMGCTHYPVYRPALEKRLPGVRMIDVGEALADALRPLFAESRGTGAVEYYVTERSAAFDEIVRVMDGALDPAAIRVENAFIL